MASADEHAVPQLPTRAILVRAGTAGTHELRHGRGASARLAGPDVGGGDLVVREVTIRPGTPAGPYHVHHHAENTYFVLEGELEVRVADGTHRLAPGEAIFIPAGAAHATHNPTTSHARLLAIYDRTVADDFFEVTATEVERQ